MRLFELKQHFLKFPKGYLHQNGLSEPFSWRGSFDEVAFSICEYHEMTNEEILENIELAYTEFYNGYKGSIFEYDDDTPINFEQEGSRYYSDGEYTEMIIAKFAENYNSVSNKFIHSEEILINCVFPIK